MIHYISYGFLLGSRSGFFLGKGYENCLLVSVWCHFCELPIVCKPLLLEGQIVCERGEVQHIKIEKDDAWMCNFNHHGCFPWKIKSHPGLQEQAKPVVHCLEDDYVKQHQTTETGWKVGVGQWGVPVHSLYWCPRPLVSLFQYTITKPSNFLCNSGEMSCRSSKIQGFFQALEIWGR